MADVVESEVTGTRKIVVLSVIGAVVVLAVIAAIVPESRIYCADMVRMFMTFLPTMFK